MLSRCCGRVAYSAWSCIHISTIYVTWPGPTNSIHRMAVYRRFHKRTCHRVDVRWHVNSKIDANFEPECTTYCDNIAKVYNGELIALRRRARCMYMIVSRDNSLYRDHLQCPISWYVLCPRSYSRTIANESYECHFKFFRLVWYCALINSCASCLYLFGPCIQPLIPSIPCLTSAIIILSGHTCCVA